MSVEQRLFTVEKRGVELVWHRVVCVGHVLEKGLNCGGVTFGNAGRQRLSKAADEPLSLGAGPADEFPASSSATVDGSGRWHSTTTRVNNCVNRRTASLHIASQVPASCATTGANASMLRSDTLT